MVKILSSACTTFFPNYQLFLPMDIGVNISKSAPVRVISKLLEGLDYRYLMQAYSKNRQGCNVYENEGVLHEKWAAETCIQFIDKRKF